MLISLAKEPRLLNRAFYFVSTSLNSSRANKKGVLHVRKSVSETQRNTRSKSEMQERKERERNTECK